MENKEIIEEKNESVEEITNEEGVEKEHNDTEEVDEENTEKIEIDEKIENNNESEKNDEEEKKEEREKKNKKKFTRKEKIIIGVLSLVVVICIFTITNAIIDSNKGFKIVKVTKNNKKIKEEKQISYKEYEKNTTEFYYERMLVKMSKDYEPIITMGTEKIFEKKDTKQRMVIYVKENKDSKSMGKAYLRKSVKKLNKKAEYKETVKFEDFEYDIYEGKDKDGKYIKYAIAANTETKVMLTYTYAKEGQDSDFKLILKSIIF